MANVNKAAGLLPSQYKDGNAWNGQARTYFIPQADTNAYAPGDPVTLASATADANGVPGVVLATAGPNAVLGVVVGAGRYETLMANPQNLDSVIIPAVKTFPWYVMVVDDPNVIFELQEGGVGAALTSASVNKNANLVAGANNGFVSGWQLDNNSLGVGATLQLKLIGLKRTADNAFGQYAKWLVTINNHVFSSGTAGF